MKKIYDYFKEFSKSAATSSHWNHLTEVNLEKFFLNQDFFNSFLRRYISVGINDVSLHFNGEKWSKKSASPEDFIPLSQEVIEADCLNCRFAVDQLKLFKNLNWLDYLGSTIGEPYFSSVVRNHEGKQVLTNFHEATLLYFAALIHSYTKNQDQVNLLEIGSGFGGLVVNLLRLNTKLSKIYLIDLPVNLILAWFYIDRACKDYGLDVRLKLMPNESVTEHSETCIYFVPIDLSSQIPKVNVVVNTRSFMEMKLETINEYFNLIQEKIQKDGIFFNINRFSKKSSEERILLKNFPYDLYWQVLQSTRGFQKGTWELITIRTESKNYSLPERIRTIPPWEFL
jgi:putative sugar O-methyltransferase